MKPLDIIGKRFGKLTVLTHHHRNEGYRNFYECLCDCGNKKIVYKQMLTSGKTTHCGCLFVHPAIIHGLSHVPEHGVWLNIINRCTKPNDRGYKNYGGRGIKICDKWLNSFVEFYNDMGSRPSNKHSIDRIDNNGDYCPENCKWETKHNQCRNQRRNLKITYNGETMCVTDWAKKMNLNVETLACRIRKNKMTIEDAINTDTKVHYTRRAGFVKWSIRKKEASQQSREKTSPVEG